MAHVIFRFETHGISNVVQAFDEIGALFSEIATRAEIVSEYLGGW